MRRLEPNQWLELEKLGKAEIGLGDNGGRMIRLHRLESRAVTGAHPAFGAPSCVGRRDFRKNQVQELTELVCHGKEKQLGN